MAIAAIQIKTAWGKKGRKALEKRLKQRLIGNHPLESLLSMRAQVHEIIARKELTKA